MTEHIMKIPMPARNAITEALREVEKCPDDSIQDIFNEYFEKWKTGLKMNHCYEIEYDI